MNCSRIKNWIRTSILFQLIESGITMFGLRCLFYSFKDHRESTISTHSYLRIFSPLHPHPSRRNPNLNTIHLRQNIIRRIRWQALKPNPQHILIVPIDTLHAPRCLNRSITPWPVTIELLAQRPRNQSDNPRMLCGHGDAAIHVPGCGMSGVECDGVVCPGAYGDGAGEGSAVGRVGPGAGMAAFNVECAGLISIHSNFIMSSFMISYMFIKNKNKRGREEKMKWAREHTQRPPHTAPQDPPLSNPPSSPPNSQNTTAASHSPLVPPPKYRLGRNRRYSPG
jgi:hypothetical protein